MKQVWKYVESLTRQGQGGVQTESQELQRGQLLRSGWVSSAQYNSKKRDNDPIVFSEQVLSADLRISLSPQRLDS